MWGFSDRGGSSHHYLYKVTLEYFFFIDKIRTCPRFIFFFKAEAMLKGYRDMTYYLKQRAETPYFYIFF